MFSLCDLNITLTLGSPCIMPGLFSKFTCVSLISLAYRDQVVGVVLEA